MSQMFCIYLVQLQHETFVLHCQRICAHICISTLHILVEGTQVSQFAVVYNLRAFERGSIFGTNEVHVCGITKPLTS